MRPELSAVSTRAKNSYTRFYTREMSGRDERQDVLAGYAIGYAQEQSIDAQI